MRQRGELKMLVLDSLGDGRWHYPRQIAGALSFGRRGQLHAYLLRLCDEALVERAPDSRRPVYIYRLTERGCRLLLAHHWHERQQRGAEAVSHQPLPASTVAANSG